MFSLIQKDRNSGQRSENTFSLYETGKDPKVCLHKVIKAAGDQPPSH